MTHKELEDAADAEMLANLHRSAEIHLPLSTLMGVVGMVQLACRHPHIGDHVRQSANDFVDQIGENLQGAGLHGLAALVKAGWSAEFDEEPTP